jgi:RNA polymerase subunit RPABC4/transcription elongation factor Spt4
MKECLSCGREVQDHAQVCGYCGKNPNITEIQLPIKTTETKEQEKRETEKKIRKMERAAGLDKGRGLSKLGGQPSAQAFTDLPGQGIDRQGVNLHKEKVAEDAARKKKEKSCEKCGAKFFEDDCPKCGTHPSAQAMTDVFDEFNKKKE